MKTKLTLLLLNLAFCSASFAGVITHTDYTAGSVITSAAQNTNENTIVNEFNGNISAANLASNAVTTAKITDANVTVAKLETNLQSTFTFVNTMGAYRRPVIQTVNTTSVDVEANTGTSNQTCITFPDVQRCVTENTGSTSVNRRLIDSETASYTGTKNSGMTPGETVANNTWYAVYAVKVQDNSTDFVLAASTNVPVQANYARLNVLYGVNGWVYLGMIRNGDSSSSASSLLGFTQDGALTIFTNAAVTNVGDDQAGIRLATTASATSLGWTYQVGTSSTAIPSNINMGYFQLAMQGTASNTNTTVKAIGGTNWVQLNAVNNQEFSTALVTVSGGAVQADTNAVKRDILFRGYVDSVLGVGMNPQL